MKKAINLVSIKEGHLLLVRNKDLWILPGGKPEELDKSNYDTLEREIHEEISGTEFMLGAYYGTFIDKTLNPKEDLEAIVYFGVVHSLGKPSAEISEAKYIKKFEDYNLSDITRKIVKSLMKDRYLRNGRK